MNQVQRMVLVPAELSNRPQQIKGVASVISSLDEELEEILNTGDISADEKWRRYSSVLSRYLRHLDEERKPIAIPLLGEEKKEDADFVQIIRHDIASVIPKKFRSVASVLYDRLASPLGRRLITWDPTGQVTIGGELIPHSHILNFISDVCRARKSFHVEGWEKFAAVLKELALPADLIGNPKYQTGSGLSPPVRRSAGGLGRAATSRATPRHAAAEPSRATRRHAPALQPVGRPPAPHAAAEPSRATPRHAATGRPAGRAPPFKKWCAW